MLKYPITLTPDSNGTYLVGFPDFPEAHSVGDDTADARPESCRWPSRCRTGSHRHAAARRR